MTENTHFAEVRTSNGTLVRRKSFPNYREATQYAGRVYKREQKLGNQVSILSPVRK
jgi:hypothetical protein